ncbi:MAG: ThiF family adenylyltransferase [Armatimonadetes bacterium]|nr:ThiF family adenylyltransferase [Armatimonadota bacterium]
MSIYFHEQLYRTPELMATLRDFPVTVCGAGALGGNLTESLARSGFQKLTVIDRDRVEERNLSTQPYQRGDVGAHKAKILANGLYRALGVPVQGQVAELDARNAPKLLKGSGLVVDTFDNSSARRSVAERCAATAQPCLHAGLAADYAEVLWNDCYRVPSASQDDVCDYPLARNLVVLTVAVACETIVRFVSTGRCENWTATLRDFAVRPWE